MALTATWEAANARVLLQATGVTGATSCVISYRLSGATAWNVVRGAGSVAVSADAIPPQYQHDPPVGQDGTATIEYQLVPNTGATLTTSVAISVADQAWLKFVGFPFLNRALTIVDYSDVQRDGRSALNNVINARTPIGVGEFMGPRTVDVTLRLNTWADWRALDDALSIGGVLYLLADEQTLGLPVMYAMATSVKTARSAKHFSERRYVTISLTEVTQPGYAYAGSIGTWQTVLNNYATWAAVAAAQPTWGDLLMLAGAAGDVIVG